MNDALTPERQQAQSTFLHAMERYNHGKVADAVELAETAVEYDGGYLDARRWLAQQYEDGGEHRKASRHLQAIVHHDHEDLEAWERLGRVDPQAAERLHRVSELPPDPFVTQRTTPVSDFGDLEDMDEVVDDGLAPVFVEDRLLPGEVDGGVLEEIEDVPAEDLEVVTHHAADLSDVLADEGPAPAVEAQPCDAVDDRPVTTSAPPPAVAEPEPQPPPLAEGSPMPWEHEQDRQCRDMMQAHPLLGPIIDRINETWKDPDTWQPVLADCAHASKHSHGDLYEAAETARQILGGPTVTPLLAPEGSPHCLPLRGPDCEIVFNTGLLRLLKPPEFLFAVGRLLGVHRSGHCPYFHTTLMVTDRSARVLGLCEEAIKEYLWDLMGSWFESHPKPDRQAACAIAHAWHLRGELTCDRAGLLVSGDLGAACDTIAKTCCHTGAQAQHTDSAGLLTKHASDDVGQLAAIPVTEDPRYNEGYAVYRIHMLRWWHSTDDYRALAAQLRPG